MDDNQKINFNTQWRESSFKALIPFVVFVIFYFGFSVATKDFSKVPMSIAFVISSAVALSLNHKEKLSKKVEIFALGMGNSNIMIMCLIFILAGAFASIAKAVGGVDSIVYVAQSFIPSKFIVSGLFMISAVVSLAIGTSCGTIAAIVPIASLLATSFGISVPVALAAVIGGAMFGDNLSLISDTAIASAKTQNVEMRDKMIYNLRIIIIPAILCTFLYMLPIFTTDTSNMQNLTLTFENYIKITPYILLLIFGIAGVNVMLLLLLGIILNLVLGLIYHNFTLFESFQLIAGGITDMSNTIIVALLAGGLLQMVKYNGGINFILTVFEKFINSQKLCKFGICLLVAIINLFTANNTVAIITSGPIVKEMSLKYNVNPKRTASLLDTTSCMIQGIIPYGAQILIALGLTSGYSISAFSIMKNLYYPFLIGVGLAVYLIFSKDEYIQNV